MTPERRSALRRYFAGAIAGFRRHDVRDTSLLRTLLDSWFAYECGGDFVKPTGNPRTFNKPTGRLEFAALGQLRCRSVDAQRVLEGRASERLIKDHCIPVAALRWLMLEELPDDPTLDAVEDWLRRRYHVAALTFAENERIAFSDRMPPAWDGADPYARYVGIELCPQG